jgi:hypothetical protein
VVKEVKTGKQGIFCGYFQLGEDPNKILFPMHDALLVDYNRKP